MIDFHCHLDLYTDPAHAVKHAITRGTYVLAVTTTPRAWHGTRRLVANATRIRVAVGLHPELVHERYQEVETLCALLSETLYVGEIGLDGSPQHRNSFALQEQVLQSILAACSDYGGRICTLHSRSATTGVLDMIQAHPSSGTPILHWFSGSLRELERANRLGCWFSVGPAMLRTRKGSLLAAAMPPERVLTETDGPFARNGNIPLMPWDVSEAEARLAEIWGVSVSQVSEQLHSNLKKLLLTHAWEGSPRS